MILKHRDRELLRFEWTGARGVRVLSVNERERKFLPIDMFGQVSDESLWKWLTHRVAPISRTNIQNLLLKQGLDLKDTRHVLELCRALSLNDVWLSFPGGVTREMKERLKKLIGFRFAPHHTHNLHVERLRKIESFLQKRVLGIIEFGVKADDLLNITQTPGTINQDHGYDSLAHAIIENIRTDSYITQEELCDVLSVTRSVLTKAMSRLQLSGRLVRVGSRKAGYWQMNNLIAEG